MVVKTDDLFGGTVQNESEVEALEEQALAFYQKQNPKYNFLMTLGKEVPDGVHIVFIPAIRSVTTGEVQVNQELMDLAVESGVAVQTIASHQMETVTVKFGK